MKTKFITSFLSSSFAIFPYFPLYKTLLGAPTLPGPVQASLSGRQECEPALPARDLWTRIAGSDGRTVLKKHSGEVLTEEAAFELNFYRRVEFDWHSVRRTIIRAQRHKNAFCV